MTAPKPAPPRAPARAPDPSGRLAELREAFDASFALPPSPPHEDRIDLLAVTAGTERVAVTLATMAGLVADRVVTALPAAPPHLLGVAGLRGHLVPVYDLARMIGTRTDSVLADRIRWLILAAGSPVFAVAVDRVDGHLRVGRDAIAIPADGAGRRGAVVSTAEGPRPVIDLRAIRASLGTRTATGSDRPVRES